MEIENMTTQSSDFIKLPPPCDLVSSVKPAPQFVRTFFAKNLSTAVAAAMLTVGSICTHAFAAPASDVGKWFKAEQPIKDPQGRIRYIVTLEEDNTTKASEKFREVKEALDWKTAQTTEYISALVKSKGNEVVILSATSLTVPSFVAYLTEKQAKDLANDKRVVSMTEDRYGEVSSAPLPPPPWYNTPEVSGQLRSWGLAAMNNASPASSNGSATVYVLDTGVEGHNDLPSIYPANQLNALNMSNGIVVSSSYNPVGCYPHATHVAGIIGAQNNGYGSVGMVPGVNVVSIGWGSKTFTGDLVRIMVNTCT
jgi:Subtilase family/Peptidase inhibitor I9